MPRGQVDFGEYAPTKTIAGMSDMGELAVRLGSINSYERKGQVMLLDDFEDNINKWDITLTGAGGSIALSTDTARNGAKSCKVISGNVAGNTAAITRFISRAVSGRIGLEISYTANDKIGVHDFKMFTDQGANWVYGVIRCNHFAHELSYLNSAGGYTLFEDDHILHFDDHAFNQIKFVVDFETGYYVRCLVGANEYDLSKYALYTVGGAFFNFIGFEIESTTRVNAVQPTTYLDDFMLTQNEP